MRRWTEELVARAVARSAARGERGDVPGWVMVTVMTAGLVAVLWQIAGDQLGAMLSEALGSVRHP
jgi:hypothetical protein